MQDPDWAKILRYLHENDGMVYLDVGDAPEREVRKALHNQLKNDIDFSEEITKDDSLITTLNHMEHVDLIFKETSKGSAILQLESKGFDVAHERSMQKTQHWTNVMVGIFTAFLAAGAITQGAAVALTAEPSYLRTPLSVLLVTILLASGAAILEINGADIVTGKIRLVRSKVPYL